MSKILETTPLDIDRNSEKAKIVANNQIFETPKGFKIRDDGVYYFDPMDDNPKPIHICSYIEVVGRTRDEKSNNHGRILKFVDVDGKKRTWVMPMSFLAGKLDDLIRPLYDMGMTIGLKPRIKGLLAEYIQQSTDRPLSICVDRPGWFNDVYVMPDRTIGPSVENIVFQSEEITDLGFSSKGSLQEWRDNVSSFAVGNSRLLFVLSASFAAPLLPVLNDEDGGGFHLKGDSSIGKTMALMLASSVWGDPDERHNKWRATSNGLERTAYHHNHSLLVLDEIHEMNPSELGQTVYMLADGHGRNRMNQVKEKRWKVLYLSGGEINLKTSMLEAGKKSTAGQEVRFVEVPGDTGSGFGIFDQLHKFRPQSESQQKRDFSAQENTHVKMMSRKFYGAVGPMFLEKFIQNKSENIHFINETVNVFIKDTLPEKAEKQIRRVCKRFAILAAAGELATKLELTGWQPLEAYEGVKKSFIAYLGTLNNHDETHEMYEALRTVREFIALEKDHFENLDINEDRRPRPLAPAYGFKGGVGANDKFHYVYYIEPSVFVSKVCQGLDHKSVLNALETKGFLKTEPNGSNRPRQKHRLHKASMEGQQPRCYAILSSLMDSDYY